MSDPRPVASPCTSVCQMDPALGAEAGGLCRGCLRSLDEIMVWGSASDDEKRRILGRIQQRRTTLMEPR